MKPLYIFDLDGTLADAEHRTPLISGAQKDWRAFFAACTQDKPIWPAIYLFQVLRSADADCWVWTGRSDEVLNQTVNWLRAYSVLPVSHSFDADSQKFVLRMRQEGDHTPDHDLKRGWLGELKPTVEYQRLLLGGVFEDRSRVVQMWRAAGVPCYQVAQGDF